MSDVLLDKSKKVFVALYESIASFKSLLLNNEDDLIKQNIKRSMILFACAGIDAIVKQLIHEALESVIERDEGAQDQLYQFTQRKLDKDGNKLVAKLLTSRNSRKALIDLYVEELSQGSLQNAEQLYKVAAAFNIKTDYLGDKTTRDTLKQVFDTRNMIAHQMDINFCMSSFEQIEHSDEETNQSIDIIIKVSEKFIGLVESMLKKPITKDYEPVFKVVDEALRITL